jgi:hypothetical protein
MLLPVHDSSSTSVLVKPHASLVKGAPCVLILVGLLTTVSLREVLTKGLLPIQLLFLIVSIAFGGALAVSARWLLPGSQKIFRTASALVREIRIVPFCVHCTLYDVPRTARQNAPVVAT